MAKRDQARLVAWDRVVNFGRGRAAPFAGRDAGKLARSRARPAGRHLPARSAVSPAARRMTRARLSEAAARSRASWRRALGH